MRFGEKEEKIMRRLSWLQQIATIGTASVLLLLGLAVTIPVAAQSAQSGAILPPAGLVSPPVRKNLGPVGALDRGRNLSPEPLVDTGDHYFLGKGARINLLRAKREAVVKFVDTMTPAQGLQRLQEITPVPALESAGRVSFGAKGQVDLVRSSQENGVLDVKSLAASPAVVYAYSVLVDPESKCRMIPTDEILVRIPNGLALADVQPDIAAAGLQVVERTGTPRMQVYLLRLADPKKSDALTASQQLSAGNKVLWAEPNFIREVRLDLTPNDTLFSQQQNLHNTGQNGGTSDADTDNPEAWDDTVGSSSIVIAIIDDGIDTAHADLSIYYNPGESGGGKETNSIDDDGNDKVDDYRGWDFADGDNDPNPVLDNGHGTGCAGVAAAVGNNSYRTAGVAYGCKVFAVKIISDSGTFTTNQNTGNAISYAADFADVLSNSWGGGSASSYINDAIDDATNNGRGGKGCPVFFATGNSASTWYQGGSRVRLPTTGLSGDYYFGFYYERRNPSGGEEAVQIDNVCLLDSDEYTHKTGVLASQDFEGTFPPSGWWLAGDGDWYQSSVNTLTGTGGAYSARSPSLSIGQYAWLLTPLLSISGNETFTFACSVSMGTNSYFYVAIYDSGLIYIGGWDLGSGVPTTITAVSYPASYTNSIAVGASTDCDRRSDYSQYGTGLHFVAPSNGGWNDIATLDPTGSVGWTSTDYKMEFGGTSSACPHAAGIAALILSKNHHLTRDDVLYVMKRTCDKIGGVTYDSDGWNQYYGYGRLNADAALALTGAHGSTAVELVSFAASQYGNAVLLEWRTGYEVNNLGFHVYREAGGRRTQLTEQLVAGSAFLAGGGTALTAGRSYSWWDLVPGARGPVQYWLEDVDLNGQRTRHGPVTPILSDQPLPKKSQAALLAQLGWPSDDTTIRAQVLRARLHNVPPGRPAKTLVLVRSQLAEKIEKPTPGPLEVQWSLAGQPAVKLHVRQEGWYRVGQRELVAAGLDPAVNPRFLQLYVNGEEQAILVTAEKKGAFSPKDAIEFYGTGQDTLSTDARCYWLVAGVRPGRRIPVVAGHGRGTSSPQSFPFTVERKDRTIYFAALKNGESSNFFGPIVTAEPVDQVLSLSHVAPPFSRDATLEVALQGATAGPHRVTIQLNTIEVGTVVFEGQAHGSVSTAVPQSVLLEGDNLVTLAANGGATDVSLVDAIRLTYWHTYTADGNALRFTALGGQQVTIEGFSDSVIRVVDITDPAAPIEVAGTVIPQAENFGVRVKVPGREQRTLLALAADRVKSPEAVVANLPSTWHRGEQAADIAIIAHEAFIASVRPLQALREGQGWSAALIDVEDLYDEFGFGNKSALAVKSFLDLAQDSWRKPPRFVLLVGDASFDPRNYLGLGNVDFVPTKLVDTALLETASDDWFVDWNGDGLPETAIGRLPVRTAEEASVVVSKIVGYEQARSGQWTKKALLVADNPDVYDFETQSASVGSLLPEGISVEGVFLGWTDIAMARSMLREKLNAGQLLVNYLGHGSVELWASEALFSSDDAAGLTNSPRLPFVVSMTCLNGFFHDLYAECLAEALLKARQGGAVAVWASSGLTEPYEQTVVNKELIRLLFGGGAPTLGEAVLGAKASSGSEDVRRTWILLGDPATRLK